MLLLGPRLAMILKPKSNISEMMSKLRVTTQMSASYSNFSKHWKSLEHIHCQYLPGIKEQKRQQEVEQRFLSIKEVSNIRQECQIHKCSAQQDDDNASVSSLRSSRSHNSSSSKASSTSCQKERLKAALLAKKKLELVRARAAEEAEEHRKRGDEETSRKLWNLEEVATLTELEWKIEAEYDEETGVLRSVEPNA